MNFRHALLAGAACVAFATPAAAGHFKGWYLAIEGGSSWIDDVDALYTRTFDNSLAASNAIEATFDDGWAVFASVGYAFQNQWRVEGEFGYRTNDVAARWLGFDSFRQLSGSVDEFSLMANALYDIALGERLTLTLGAGAGGDHVQLDGVITGSGGPAPIDDEDWRFAAQGLAGLSYKLSPRLALTMTYRYLHVSAPAFSQSGFVSVFPTSQTVGFDDLAKHSVSAGLRFDLFADEAPMAAPPAAPPPPLPPPPPPAVKQFVVFFDFDKCEITAEADRVLADAAATAKSTGAAAIAIVGHTDTSGSTAYNQRLSNCRSNAAKTNLVAKGLPEEAITASGRGEAELMVETGDGVKEPQNRRATVDLK